MQGNIAGTMLQEFSFLCHATKDRSTSITELTGTPCLRSQLLDVSNRVGIWADSVVFGLQSNF